MKPKFRAWSSKTAVLAEVINIDFREKKLKVSHWEYGDSIYFPLGEVELMQSTGLKDKNGVEIFEGDIVRVFEYGIYGGTYNAPISWIKYETEQEQWAFHGFTCVGVKEIEHHPEVESLFTRGFITRKFGSCVQLSELTKDSRNSIEVIGNIYEDKELLEVEG